MYVKCMCSKPARFPLADHFAAAASPGLDFAVRGRLLESGTRRLTCAFFADRCPALYHVKGVFSPNP